MMIYNNITEITGATPLINLTRIIPPGGARVLLKLEYFNPLSSIKDRVARSMIESAEKKGILTPESKIMEATCGNMGISLAFIAAAKGYPLTLVMPDSVSQDRQNLLKMLGAKIILTPGQQGMSGSVRQVHDLQKCDSKIWVPQQFENPANPQIHETTTGPEIWEQANGEIDLFLAGIGTGGTFSGITKYLRSKKPAITAIALEPATCSVLSGGRLGPHGIPGIGSGFIPKNLDMNLISSVETVTTEEAYYWARRIAREEGLLVGISTGANLAVAARLAARRENIGKTIVTVAFSSGERYLSTQLYAENSDFDNDD